MIGKLLRTISCSTVDANVARTMARQVNIGQRQRRQGPAGILGQAAIAHLIPVADYVFLSVDVKQAQVRERRERIAAGIWVNLFQASQQTSMICSSVS